MKRISLLRISYLMFIAMYVVTCLVILLVPTVYDWLSETKLEGTLGQIDLRNLAGINVFIGIFLFVLSLPPRE